MKKLIIAVVTAVIILASIQPVAAQQTLSAALLMDFETGQIVYAENIDEALPPASITKLMTMHLIFEALAEGRISLTDEVQASANASNLPPGSSTIFLGTGEILTVDELLRAVAIISANDAGIALAEHIAGSERAFVDMMNEKADELGLTQSIFFNSHGLHIEGHTMSARDIAILSKITLELYPEITQYSSQKYQRMERETRYVRQGYFDMHSTFASLIGWRNIDGLKTGWTPEAKRGITVTAQEGGRRYIAVVLGADSISQRDQKVRELLAMGFDQYQPQTPIKAGEVIDHIEIKQAKNTQAAIVASEDIKLIMHRSAKIEDFEQQVEIAQDLQAPMAKGDTVGTISYYLDGDIVTMVDLVLEQDLVKANLFTRSLRFLSQTLTNLGTWVLDLVKN